MRVFLYMAVLFIFFSCDSDDSVSSNVVSNDFDRIYVTLQGTDKVAIVNASNLEVIEQIDVVLDMMNGDMGGNMDGDMDGSMMSMNTPHYVALDEENGYWFISAIMSNKIAMYSIDTNELIDQISVNEDPAILEINTSSKTLYSSRMMVMDMGGMNMGSTANSIDAISYDENGMTLSQSYDSQAPTPHGISLSDDGIKIVTASNSSDFLSIINTISGIATTVSLDPDINDADPTLVLNRLKPLEVVQKGIYAFVSCTGGEWQNINTGTYEDVNGQVQVWNTETLQKVATYEFNLDSRPWHIDYYEDKIYVVLSGSSSGAGAGVACLSFDGSSFLEEWTATNSDFNTLHGITISSDGQYIYVSGRGDGNLYKLDAQSGNLLNNINLVSTGMSRTGGIAITQ